MVFDVGTATNYCDQHLSYMDIVCLINNNYNHFLCRRFPGIQFMSDFADDDFSQKIEDVEAVVSFF